MSLLAAGRGADCSGCALATAIGAATSSVVRSSLGSVVGDDAASSGTGSPSSGSGRLRMSTVGLMSSADGTVL